MSDKSALQSMTGYAVIIRDLEAGRLQLELRGVNSRFLDLHFRIPDEIRGVEPALREIFSAGIARGKVECRIGWTRAAGRDRLPAIDRRLLEHVVATARQVHEFSPEASPPTVADLLRWPGVIQEPSLDPEAMQRELVAAARTALAEFQASRHREGVRMAQAILSRSQRMRELVQKLETRTPALLAAFEAKLVERLRGALTQAVSGSALPLDEVMDRIRQEVVLHGLRIDVSEELSRLRAHLEELERIVSAGGAAGKRLDFLMQELNREANTLGSKGASIDLADAAIELKLLIEQVREQVQNIE